MIAAETSKKTCCKVEGAILFTLQYFAIWQYPLKAEEINQHINIACNLSEIKAAILRLEEKHIITSVRGFYSTNNNIEEQISRRIKGNTLAQNKYPAALLAGKIIYAFPFVRFVGISGSLSKGYAEKNSDFDFFIVTAENRLWICRTILHVFKKCTFVFGQQHRFCMNYFIDTTALEIEEKNHYTAIELATLIPVKGNHIYTDLQDANSWLKHFLPNAYMQLIKPEKPGLENAIKLTAEFVFNHLFANSVNAFLMQLTNERWRKKWTKKNYPVKEYEHAFKTRINVSKNHPANYQKKVLEQLKKIELMAFELLQR
ncbi:MAG: hypothetical protein ACXWD4_13630 [Bacteroidia bacterium]